MNYRKNVWHRKQCDALGIVSLGNFGPGIHVLEQAHHATAITAYFSRIMPPASYKNLLGTVLGTFGYW